MAISGPAAGHPLMRTSADPTGMQALGTLNNCAGGVTPWGTILSAEEHIQNYFTGRAADLAEQSLRALHTRYAVGTGRYGWARYYDRFDLKKEPHEPNRFGWIVEIDPYDPQSVPIKRTAMGRMSHEGATIILSGDSRPVAYMGDDARFEYLYKFVAADATTLAIGRPMRAFSIRVSSMSPSSVMMVPVNGCRWSLERVH